MNIPSIHIICWIAGYIDPSPCWSEGNICSRRFTRVMRWPPLPYSYSAAWFAAPLLSLTSIPSGNWVWYGLFNANSPIHAYNVNDSWEGTYSMRFAADRNFVKCLTKVCSETEYPDFCVGNPRDILHGKDSKLFECSPQWRTVSALLNRTAGTPAWPPCHIFHRPLDDDNSPPQPPPQPVLARSPRAETDYEREGLHCRRKSVEERRGNRWNALARRFKTCLCSPSSYLTPWWPY